MPDPPILAARSGLVLWLDPEDGVTTTSGFAWQDRSNQHNNARAPAGAEPMLEQPSTDLPRAVWFSGIGQYLKLPSGMSDFTGGLSLFVVAEPWARLSVEETDAARFIDFAAAETSQNDSILFCRYDAEASSLLYQVYVGANAVAPERAADAVANYSRQLFEVVAGGGKPADATTTRYFKNGGALSTGKAQVPYVLNRTSNLIGRSNFRIPPDAGIHPDPHYRGFLAEIILYNRALSDDERRAVEAYLLTRCASLTSG